MGTMLMRRDRPAENSISRDSILGMVPISSPRSQPGWGASRHAHCMDRQHLPVICCRNRLTIKYFVLSSLRQYDKDCRFELQRSPVSMEPSKHRIAPSPRKAFSLGIWTRGSTARHGLICGIQGGLGKTICLMPGAIFCISSWNWFLPFTGEEPVILDAA